MGRKLGVAGTYEKEAKNEFFFVSVLGAASGPAVSGTRKGEGAGIRDQMPGEESFLFWQWSRRAVRHERFPD
jgi:hypothetical protein